MGLPCVQRWSKMADILKITTPLVNKNTQAQPVRQQLDPEIPFHLQNVATVLKTGAQGEILQQNNGLIQKEEAPNILLNLLKDPSVTVNFLKNIFMLQEIIKLLPVNNETMTEELDGLFNTLLVRPEEIVAEMIRQENTSTVFKGELFDFLRQLLSQTDQPEMRYGISNFLKSVNTYTGKRDILDAVANSLQFLSDSVEPSKSLSGRLRTLSEFFRHAQAKEDFPALKREAFVLMEEVENSILYTPKMEKVTSMLTYNLSRFNDNQDFLPESAASLLTLIDGAEQKAQFTQLVRRFLQFLRPEAQVEEKEPSQVMDTLAKLLGIKSEETGMTLLNSEKVDKIIQSLLSSPCNFTPLLHFVVPVEYLDIKSFAEIWLNPNGEDDERSGVNRGKTIHMLLVFDIEGIGQFETELFVNDTTIDLALFCPTAYAGIFAEKTGEFTRCISNSSYRFGSVKVERLERPRSLMEVFKSLPYKRTGVDVKI